MPLEEIIKTNVEQYFNDKVKPENQGNNNHAGNLNLIQQFANNIQQNQETRPFSEKFIERLRNTKEIFEANRENDRAVLDERGFNMSPLDYKTQIFKNCSYIKFGTDNKNKYILFPYNRIDPETLLEKIKNIKKFIDGNIETMKTDSEAAIKDLDQLSKDEYIYAILQDGNLNKNLLGTKCLSSILYYSYPQYFPRVTDPEMKALYMLSGALKPNPVNNEFVDYIKNMNKVSVKKNYPYSKFVHYEAIIFEKIKQWLSSKNICIEQLDDYKYIAVEAFLSLVYDYKEQTINVLF